MAPRSRAILLVATRFAHAYLPYQAGRHPPSVEQTIRGTCTASFARLLLAQPARIPNGERHNPAYEPAALTRITYTGQGSFGPGPPVQIVIATYRTLRHPNTGGQLAIHLTASGGAWRVTSLG